MDRRPVIVGMTAAVLVAVAIVGFWVWAGDRAAVRPVMLDEEHGHVAEPTPKETGEVARSRITPSRVSEDQPESPDRDEAESRPWTPSQADKSNALFLSRMVEREFADVLRYVTSSEKA